MASRDERFRQIQIKLRALAGALLELAEEVGAAAVEAPTVGQQAKRLLDLYVSFWQQHYVGGKYAVHNGGKLMNLLKTLLRTLTPEDVEGRMRAYLKSTDPFYVQAKHPLEMFVAAVNKFAPAEHERQLFDTEAQVDWFEDCKAKHAGACNGRYAHTLKCRMDAPS